MPKNYILLQLLWVDNLPLVSIYLLNNPKNGIKEIEMEEIEYTWKQLLETARRKIQVHLWKGRQIIFPITLYFEFFFSTNVLHLTMLFYSIIYLNSHLLKSWRVILIAMDFKTSKCYLGMDLDSIFLLPLKQNPRSHFSTNTFSLYFQLVMKTHFYTQYKIFYFEWPFFERFNKCIIIKHYECAFQWKRKQLLNF